MKAAGFRALVDADSNLLWRDPRRDESSCRRWMNRGVNGCSHCNAAARARCPDHRCQAVTPAPHTFVGRTLKQLELRRGSGSR